jgi:glycerophosphoryl diester phosphodiesterase
MEGTMRSSQDSGLDTPLQYPRLIAHRGLSGLIPENTLPAFGGAIGLGVQEIEFDIRLTLDEELVVCHDPTVDRTSNGHGRIDEMTWSEIAQLDAGSWFNPDWAGIAFCRLEDIFRMFGGLAIMNIHIKALNPREQVFVKIHELVQTYNLIDTVYIAGKPEILEVALHKTPMIRRCCLETDPPSDIVQTASRLKCSRVQFRRDHVTEKQIRLAHENSLICNLFYSDNYLEAKLFFDMGIDAIISNFPNRFFKLIASMRNEGRKF